MNRRWMLVALAAVPLVAEAGSLDSLTSMVSDPLVGSLKSKLGVTDAQAKGGLGSLFTLAKEHLAAGDFEKIATLVPSTQKYLDAAKSLGAVTGPVKNSSGLNAAYSRLGIKPETAAKFTPAVLDAVGKVGGDSVRSLLAGALK